MQRITILLCKFFIQYPQFLFYWDTRLSPSFFIMKAETAHQTLSDEMRNDSWTARNRTNAGNLFPGIARRRYIHTKTGSAVRCIYQEHQPHDQRHQGFSGRPPGARRQYGITVFNMKNKKEESLSSL